MSITVATYAVSTKASSAFDEFEHSVDAYQDDDIDAESVESVHSMCPDARDHSKSQLVSLVVSQCRYNQLTGVDALRELNDALQYMTSREKVHLSRYHALPDSFESDGWTFYTPNLLKYVGDISRELQFYCPRGWFSVYVTQNKDDKLCCNISVNKRRY